MFDLRVKSWNAGKIVPEPLQNVITKFYEVAGQV